ncbi:MAG: pilus assembly protein TadG-related protein [Pseudomonadota bacterium]
MLSRINAAVRRLCRDRRGSVSTIVLISVPAMVSIAGVTEYAAIHAMKARLQATADAAAVASIQVMPNYGSAQAMGRSYGEKNMPPATHGIVIPTANVERGVWNDGSKTFAIDGAGLDLRVTAERTIANGNPLPLRFISLFTGTTIDVSAAAVARKVTSGTGPVDDCFAHGIVSDGTISLVSHADVALALCLHAQDQVTIASHTTLTSGSLLYGGGGVSYQHFNTFEPDVTLAMPDLSDLSSGYFTTGSPILQEGEMVVADDVDPAATVASVFAGTYDLPGYLTGAVSTSASEARHAPQVGTQYNIAGNLTIDGTTVRDVAIIVDGNITVSSYARLEDVLLVASGTITLEPHITMGDDFCNDGPGATLLAGGNITVGSHQDISGVRIETDGVLALGAHVTGEAISARTTGNVTIAGHMSLAPCGNGKTPVGTPGTQKMVLAQ